MKQRGRRSSASLSVVSTEPLSPPEPPSELTKRQVEIWRNIVSAMPPDWFLRAPQLLVQYCRWSKRMCLRA